jgi:cyanophycin synthetase
VGAPVTRALLVLARRGKAGAVAAAEIDRLRAGVWRPPGGDVPGRHEVYLTLWERAAAGRGVGVDDWGDGFFALSCEGRQVVVHDNQVPLDDPVTLALAADKAQSRRLLEAAGLPVARQVVCTLDDLAPAARFLHETGGPSVVKPAAGTGAGQGVTCGVRTEDDLGRAAVRAARWGPSLVVEEQAEGDELRVLVLDGRVLGALRRHPPRVTGDGRSSVATLVAAENARRVEARGRLGLWPLALDLDALLALARQGLSPRSVPEAGRVVEVGDTANENGPADNETVDLLPAVHDTACAAATALGLRLASVELVGGSIVEVNGTPGLHYHAQVADPAGAVDVFGPIIDTLFAQEPAP